MPAGLGLGASIAQKPLWLAILGANAGEISMSGPAVECREGMAILRELQQQHTTPATTCHTT